MSFEDNILRSQRSVPNIEYNSVGEYVWNELLKLDERTVCLIEARTEEQLTIAELKTRANSIAVALIERGINKTDKIAFSGQNSIQHSILRVVAYFLGNTTLPLSTLYEKYEVEQEVSGVGANIIICEAKEINKFIGVANEAKLVVTFDGKHDKYVTYEQLLEEGRDQTLERIPYFDVNPLKDMFALLHTSGSTGRPKCAMIPHTMVLNIMAEKDCYLHINGSIGCVSAFIFPFGHVSGALIFPMHVTSGATLILFSAPTEEEIFKYTAKYSITYLPILPYICRNLIDSPFVDKYDMSSLKKVQSGGAALGGFYARSLIDKYNVSFREGLHAFCGEEVMTDFFLGYAMTEYFFITEGQELHEQYAGSMGRVTSGTELKIVDLTTGDAVGVGIDGEVRIRGNKLFAGYFNNDSATKESFDSEGWFRTGDIGHYDHLGRIYITDRLNELLTVVYNRLYIHISPVEIEMFLATHKAIADAVVVGVGNSIGTHCPRAYIMLKTGQTVSADEIIKFISDTLATVKHLTGGVIFVDSIQRTSIGKVDRKYYRNLVKDGLIIV